MRSNARERQGIVDYVAMRSECEETVELLEKVHSEHVAGQKHDTWNVHTDKGRYWVITEPTNWYSQEQFPHMDAALTFHIGLMIRVLERSPYAPEPERVVRFADSLRQLNSAEEALAKAEEAVDFQAIGNMCRECLLAFVHEAAIVVGPPADGKELYASDFKQWSEHIAGTIASGGEGSNVKRRGYLKDTAKVTWEFVAWLVHSPNATRFDAKFAVESTGWIIAAFANTLLRWEHGHPERCPQCGSYQLSMVYLSESDDSKEKLHYAECAVCGWKEEPSISTYGEKPKKATKPRRRRAGDSDDHVIVEVPLRGPLPPKPSK